MADPIRALVALDNDIDHEMVNSSLPATAAIQLVGVVDGLDESWATLQETPTDLLVVACGAHSERALFLIDGAVKQQPERPVVVLTVESANGFTRRVFEAGADDILTLPEEPSNVRFAFEKAIARRRGGSAGAGIAVAPMLVVLGPKGGTGKTLTACNLAVRLAAESKRVVLVDLDLQFGDVGLSLGLTPDRTVYDLAKAGGSLDSDKLEGYLTKHRSGVRALLAPTRPDHAGSVTTEFLREVYATLRASNDFVIVDTPPGFTPEVIASIDSSSDVCMVAMLDSLSLKNTKLGLETLELMGYQQSHIRFVLNRADSRVGITDDDVATIVGRAPDVKIPSDRDVPRSVNQGEPIVRSKSRSEPAKAFRTLTSMYLASDASQNGGSRRRFSRKG
jgi:pilus assembly protein CpaE